jgi:hypothetical protein
MHCTDHSEDCIVWQQDRYQSNSMAGGRGRELETEQHGLWRCVGRTRISCGAKHWHSDTGLSTFNLNVLLLHMILVTLCLPALFWKCWQLDIYVDFEIESFGSEETNETDGGCGGGAVQRSSLGPFGLLVIADQTLSELTPVYFRLANSSGGGLKTYFCADERRYAWFLWCLFFFFRKPLQVKVSSCTLLVDQSWVLLGGLALRGNLHSVSFEPETITNTQSPMPLLTEPSSQPLGVGLVS